MNEILAAVLLIAVIIYAAVTGYSTGYRTAECSFLESPKTFAVRSLEELQTLKVDNSVYTFIKKD